MLRQEQETLQQNATPQNVYVTAQELNSAIAAIEARREAERRAHADRISVDEAVRELSLDVTPEELLAEVQAQRTTQAGTPSAQTTASTASVNNAPRSGGEQIFAFLMWIVKQIFVLLRASLGAVNAAHQAQYEARRSQPWWMDHQQYRHAQRAYRKQWKRAIKAQIKAAKFQFFVIDPPNPLAPPKPPMPIDLHEFLRNFHAELTQTGKQNEPQSGGPRRN